MVKHIHNYNVTKHSSGVHSPCICLSVPFNPDRLYEHLITHYALEEKDVTPEQLAKAIVKVSVKNGNPSPGGSNHE